jgi:hypothetical protein
VQKSLEGVLYPFKKKNWGVVIWAENHLIERPVTSDFDRNAKQKS